MTDHPPDEQLTDDDEATIEELDLDAADAVFDRGASVAELAAQQRAWRFGHVIIDEAQDLTPMQWRMVARRARGNSMTIVGDLAQRSTGEPGAWRDHLPPSISSFSYRELTTNYRSPAEVNELAAGILAELAPGLSRANSIRRAGVAPRAIESTVDDFESRLDSLIGEEQAAAGDGKVAVIGLDGRSRGGGVASIHPRASKGLEFDSVIVVEPSDILAEPYGLSLLYVAVTRTTRRLTFFHTGELPDIIRRSLA